VWPILICTFVWSLANSIRKGNARRIFRAAKLDAEIKLRENNGTEELNRLALAYGA
jgi:hypothetical protein